MGDREGEIRRALVQLRGAAARTWNGNNSMVESIRWRINYGAVTRRNFVRSSYLGSLALRKLPYGIL